MARVPEGGGIGQINLTAEYDVREHDSGADDPRLLGVVDADPVMDYGEGFQAVGALTDGLLATPYTGDDARRDMKEYAESAAFRATKVTSVADKWQADSTTLQPGLQPFNVAGQDGDRRRILLWVPAGQPHPVWVGNDASVRGGTGGGVVLTAGAQPLEVQSTAAVWAVPDLAAAAGVLLCWSIERYAV